MEEGGREGGREGGTDGRMEGEWDRWREGGREGGGSEEGREGGREGVGSRGFLDLRGLGKLKNLRQPQAGEWKKFLSDICRAAISGSHQIWCTRNWKDSAIP